MHKLLSVYLTNICCTSIMCLSVWDIVSQFSHSVMSDSLWPHGLQHSRPPCPSPTPRVYPLMSIELVMPSNHLILCHPLLLLPSIFLSIRIFSNESVLHIRWPQYWSFSFCISPSNEYSGLISFRMELMLLNTTIQKHQFFGTQLSLWSNFNMTTRKTIAFTRRTFVGKVISLLFNMLSRLVMTFLPRSKHLLISWLQSPLQWFWSPRK